MNPARGKQHGCLVWPASWHCGGLFAMLGGDAFVMLGLVMLFRM